MSNSAGFVCIILAAGLARRFGGAKMLHPISNGRAMLAQTISRYQNSFDLINVVYPKTDLDLAGFLNNQHVEALGIEDNSKGLSQSLITGINGNLDAKGWLIALGDMPYVQSQTIEQIKNEMKFNNIVIPRFHSRVGNPIGFGRDFKEQLLMLRGDVGAKAITLENSISVVNVDVDDEGILLDIDYPSSIIRE